MIKAWQTCFKFAVIHDTDVNMHKIINHFPTNYTSGIAIKFLQGKNHEVPSNF